MSTNLIIATPTSMCPNKHYKGSVCPLMGSTHKLKQISRAPVDAYEYL